MSFLTIRDDLLASVSPWCTEGCDTADLPEARVLWAAWAEEL